MDHSKEYILEKAGQIRKSKQDFYFSNLYTLTQDPIVVAETDQAIAFAVQDRDVKRVFFSAASPEALTEVLKQMPEKSGIEIMGRTLDERAKQAILDAGYGLFATYLRATNAKLKDTYSNNIPDRFKGIDLDSYITEPTEEQIDEIRALLYSKFRPLTSHIQTKEELAQQNREKCVLVSVRDGEIVTLLTHFRQGKKLYMEHMINVGESERMHALYFKVLQDAVDDGINYAYTWMRTDNTRAHAFAGRYGLVDDKMRNFVFEKA